MALNRRDRIKGARSMAELFRRARVVPGRDASLRVLRSGTSRTTFAVIVPSSVAPIAAHRNVLRRRGSECLRGILKERHVLPGARVVITVRTDLAAAALRETLLSLLTKSGILQQ
jgi:RNase P protein component